MHHLVNVPVFALKAAVSAALGWALVRAFDNADAVSAAFVAVLCTSPTVFGGFRRARDQLLGSAVGGGIAALAVAAGLPPPLALAVAVGGAIGATFALGLGSGQAVAAFAAVYVVLVPRGGPWETLAVRVGAVALGALAAAAVTVLVSALAYHKVFDRRVRLARGLVGGALHKLAASESPPAGAMLEVFDPLTALHTELRDAGQELRWRGRGERHQIAAWLAHVQALQLVAQWGRALALRRANHAWTADDRQALSNAAQAAGALTSIAVDADDPCAHELLCAAVTVVKTASIELGASHHLLRSMK